MMLTAWIICRLALFAQLALPSSQPAKSDAPQAASTTITLPAATQPTTQPQQVNITLQTDSSARHSLVESLSETDFGQIIQGTKELKWQDIQKPGFWFGTIKNLVETLLAFIPRFLGTLVFLFVFWLIYRGIRRMAVGSMKQGQIDQSIRDMLSTLIKWCVMGFGIVIACNQLGIPIVAMLTGFSIVGLAVGFAAQETLANFIAGIVIFLDKPFKIGDWIVIEGVFGQVRRVSFRSTRILTLDGEVIVLPNTQVLSKQVSNHSTNPINRVTVPIGIAYKSSIDEARRALLKLTEGDDRLVKYPAPEVVVDQCAESSVNMLLRFWIADESVERKIGYEYTEKAKKALDAAGIEIPFPHMQLFVESTPAIDTLAKAKPAA